MAADGGRDQSRLYPAVLTLQKHPLRDPTLFLGTPAELKFFFLPCSGSGPSYPSLTAITPVLQRNQLSDCAEIRASTDRTTIAALRTRNSLFPRSGRISPGRENCVYISAGTGTPQSDDYAGS